MAKVILVTGASRGIGKATALLAAQKGFDVAVNYVHSEKDAHALVAEIVALGRRAIAVRADVTIEEEAISLFKTVVAKLGNIDVLVNNVGYMPHVSLVKDMTIDRFNQTLYRNVGSTFICSREAVKIMSTKTGGKGGAIVNVSSIAARMGSAHRYVDYAAAKAAIDTFTKGLAIEVAEEGIRVNAVRPSYIYTDLHASIGESVEIKRAEMERNIPLKRGGTPMEVATAIVWLASEEASFITGTLLDVAGGR